MSDYEDEEDEVDDVTSVTLSDSKIITKIKTSNKRKHSRYNMDTWDETLFPKKKLSKGIRDYIYSEYFTSTRLIPCEDCKVEDTPTTEIDGAIVCVHCGRVLDHHVLDDGYEHRIFEENREEALEEARVDLYYHGDGGGGGGDAYEWNTLFNHLSPVVKKSTNIIQSMCRRHKPFVPPMVQKQLRHLNERFWPALYRYEESHTTTVSHHHRHHKSYYANMQNNVVSCYVGALALHASIQSRFVLTEDEIAELICPTAGNDKNPYVKRIRNYYPTVSSVLNQTFDHERVIRAFLHRYIYIRQAPSAEIEHIATNWIQAMSRHPTYKSMLVESYPRYGVVTTDSQGYHHPRIAAAILFHLSCSYFNTLTNSLTHAFGASRQTYKDTCDLADISHTTLAAGVKQFTTDLDELKQQVDLKRPPMKLITAIEPSLTPTPTPTSSSTSTPSTPRSVQTTPSPTMSTSSSRSFFPSPIPSTPSPFESDSVYVDERMLTSWV